MEAQTLKQLGKQWDAIQKVVAALDALQVEERAGKDIGSLAIQELQNYVTANHELKQKLENQDEASKAKIRSLEDAARSLKDQLNDQEYKKSLEVGPPKYFVCPGVLVPHKTCCMYLLYEGVLRWLVGSWITGYYH